MAFVPEKSHPSSDHALEETSGESWTPLYRHDCSFPPEIFRSVMLNLIRNPNINSTRLFRADISFESEFSEATAGHTIIAPRTTHFKGYDLRSVLVRTLIPRNTVLDQPLDQTCLFFEQLEESAVRSFVVYIPHILSPTECPFYHPAVRAIALLHEYKPSTKSGTVSIQYSFFESEPRSEKLERTAHHLLADLYKHGEGNAKGYIKRVNHDVILPQAVVQNTYARLKVKYATDLIKRWVETTDPGKHVFEDLGIAAFLIELWAIMYKNQEFPGFVDIGCGNGLLVHILLEEGYAGWGFDARKRKSWSTFSSKAQENLRELVLIPALLRTKVLSNQNPQQDAANPPEALHDLKLPTPQSSNNVIDLANDIHHLSVDQTTRVGTHNGAFTRGTFIISNHADELTPWTPILSALSESSFMMIPCCSHNLTGSRFRAPASHEVGISKSTYASLVAWVSALANECGYKVEKEMLRIPSSRNAALIGRCRYKPFEEVDVADLVKRYGGAEGWEGSALKLTSKAVRGH